MEGLTVTMRPCGSFDLALGSVTWRVVHEVSLLPRPWALVALDDQGLTARHSLFDSYGTIDEALTAMVVQSGSGDESTRFRVALPCGESFIRPGKVPAERVLSSLDWTHTKRYIGYMVLTLHEAATNLDAREGFRNRINIQNARIGDMACVERANGLSRWIGDILLDRDGFVRYQDFQEDAARAFSGIGGDMLPNFDFVPRTPTMPNAASVISFPADRTRRPAA